MGGTGGYLGAAERLAVAVLLGSLRAGVFSAGFAVARAAARTVVLAGALAVFAGAVLLLAAALVGFSVAAGAATGAAVFFAKRPKRPLPRAGAAAISSLHSANVSDFGSRSFGILAFFALSVMYGP